MSAPPQSVASSSLTDQLLLAATDVERSQGEDEPTTTARPEVSASTLTPPAGHPIVVGLDLSLTATGVAHMTPTHVVTDTVHADGTGIVRLRRLAWQIKLLCQAAALVCVEGPAYHQGGNAGYHERAGLHWLVLDRLWRAGTPVAVIGPAVLKQYATGKGNSKKDAMVLAAARRFPTFDGDNNEADALWLAALGLDHLTGRSVVPAAQRAKLASVTWPTVARAS